jgi:hypothetical protein
VAAAPQAVTALIGRNRDDYLDAAPAQVLKCSRIARDEYA